MVVFLISKCILQIYKFVFDILFHFLALGTLLSIAKMPKALDPMWEYGEPIEPHNWQKLSCNLCGKEMTRGISKLKYHLARIPGHEVDICKNSTPVIIHLTNKSLGNMGKKKDHREAMRVELASGGVATSATHISKGGKWEPFLTFHHTLNHLPFF